jgi:hypothetical protein
VESITFDATIDEMASIANYCLAKTNLLQVNRTLIFYEIEGVGKPHYGLLDHSH